MVDTIYTIGYSGCKIENFLIEIKEHRISSVIDVRSNPYSQYYTDYNKENGKEQSQDDIEMRLLEYYFPNRNQLDLFENENLSNQNLIIKAYRKRNAEIGYSMEEEI